MQRSNGYGKHGQTEQLAEHAGVERGRLLGKMATAVVVNTLGTGGIRRDVGLVNVERRNDKHWHKHSQ